MSYTLPDDIYIFISETEDSHENSNIAERKSSVKYDNQLSIHHFTDEILLQSKLT